MTLADKWTRGLLAGFLAGLIQAVLTFSLKALNLTGLTWADFISILTNGHKTVTLGEAVFAEIVLYIWLSVLGSLLPLGLRVISSENLRLKGAVYGATAWFMCYAVMSLFAVPEIANIYTKTAISNGLAGTLWGLSVAIIYGRLTARGRYEL